MAKKKMRTQEERGGRWRGKEGEKEMEMRNKGRNGREKEG
jgi:hypothetical protein